AELHSSEPAPAPEQAPAAPASVPQAPAGGRAGSSGVLRRWAQRFLFGSSGAAGASAAGASAAGVSATGASAAGASAASGLPGEAAAKPGFMQRLLGTFRGGTGSRRQPGDEGKEGQGSQIPANQIAEGAGDVAEELAREEKEEQQTDQQHEQDQDNAQPHDEKRENEQQDDAEQDQETLLLSRIPEEEDEDAILLQELEAAAQRAQACWAKLDSLPRARVILQVTSLREGAPAGCGQWPRQAVLGAQQQQEQGLLEQLAEVVARASMAPAELLSAGRDAGQPGAAVADTRQVQVESRDGRLLCTVRFYDASSARGVEAQLNSALQDEADSTGLRAALLAAGAAEDAVPEVAPRWPVELLQAELLAALGLASSGCGWPGLGEALVPAIDAANALQQQLWSQQLAGDEEAAEKQGLLRQNCSCRQLCGFPSLRRFAGGGLLTCEEGRRRGLLPDLGPWVADEGVEKLPGQQEV
ncbi:unnamed protein product, partial [Polarella glacialis]